VTAWAVGDELTAGGWHRGVVSAVSDDGNMLTVDWSDGLVSGIRADMAHRVDGPLDIAPIRGRRAVPPALIGAIAADCGIAGIICKALLKSGWAYRGRDGERPPRWELVS